MTTPSKFCSSEIPASGRAVSLSASSPSTPTTSPPPSVPLLRHSRWSLPSPRLKMPFSFISHENSDLDAFQSDLVSFLLHSFQLFVLVSAMKTSMVVLSWWIHRFDWLSRLSFNTNNKPHEQHPLCSISWRYHQVFVVKSSSQSMMPLQKKFPRQ